MERRGICVLLLYNLHGGAGPTTTENWDTLSARDTGRSHVARTRILGQVCVLFQARNHEKERKRSKDAATGESRTLGLEGKGNRRAK